MEPETAGTKKPDDKQAVEHLAEAHAVLQDLRNELSQHPKLEAAILRLELALSLLTSKSGGML